MITLIYGRPNLEYFTNETHEQAFWYAYRLSSPRHKLRRFVHVTPAQIEAYTRRGFRLQLQRRREIAFYLKRAWRLRRYYQQRDPQHFNMWLWRWDYNMVLDSLRRRSYDVSHLLI